MYTKLHDEQYKNNTKLKSLSLDNITSIGHGCFYMCTNLSNIYIPTSVTRIESNCFSYCYGLRNIEIPSSITVLPDYTFYQCINLSTILLPSTLREIHHKCFFGCSNLTSLNLPNSLTLLKGSDIFYKCNKLKSIILPSLLTSIPDGCFKMCTSLSHIELSDNITNININCFDSCSSLTELKLPNNYEFKEQFTAPNLKIIYSNNVKLFCKKYILKDLELNKITDSLTQKQYYKRDKFMIPKTKQKPYTEIYETISDSQIKKRALIINDPDLNYIDVRLNKKLVLYYNLELYYIDVSELDVDYIINGYLKQSFIDIIKPEY